MLINANMGHAASLICFYLWAFFPLFWQKEMEKNKKGNRI